METELNELIVSPTGAPSGAQVVTIATPVGKQPRGAPQIGGGIGLHGGHRGHGASCLVRRQDRACRYQDKL